MKNSKIKDKFAILDINGKQHIAVEGESITVSRIEGKQDKKLTFKEVLLTSTAKGINVGSPHVNGAQVEAKIVDHSRGPKGVAFRYRNKARIRVSRGFRADLTTLEVTSIKA